MKAIRFLLFPFSILYDGITRFRNFLFDKEFLKSNSFDVPIIAVGNLSVGGTGKTPQIEYLIRLLKDQYHVAVLSRGYKRKSKGFLLADENSSVEDIGDEPMQYFKKFAALTVAVDANRSNGIKTLLEIKKPDVILLDDAFQHRKVKAKYYILLTKYDDLYTDDFILPAGNLRESKKGAKRTDSIIVTKCPKNLSPREQEEIKKKLKLTQHQKLFFTTISYCDTLKGDEEMSIADLVEKQVLLITGIANPKPLLSFLDQKNINSIHLPYADHHHFTTKDVNKIKKRFQQIKTEHKIILTTEKDFVRLENKLDKLYFIGIETKFLADIAAFNSEIINTIKK